MKRLASIIICLMAIISLSAQDLVSEDCFEESILTSKSVTAVKVKGERLKAYKLSSFKSITVNNNKRLANWVTNRVMCDAATANDREESIKNGKLQYGFYIFGKSKTNHQYIFFRNNKPDEDAVTDVTLVIMKGKASFAELKKMFK